MLSTRRTSRGWLRSCWKRATWAQFTNWIGVVGGNYITTELGDPLITESGNNLVWE